MAAIGASRVTARVSALPLVIAGGRNDFIAPAFQLSENTLLSGQRLSSETFLQRGDALAVICAAEDRSALCALAVDIEQEATPPILPHSLARLLKRAVVRLVINFGLTGFVSVVACPIGVHIFALEMRDDQERSSPKLLMDLGSDLFRQLVGVVIPLSRELRGVESAWRNSPLVGVVIPLRREFRHAQSTARPKIRNWVSSLMQRR